MPVAAPSRLPRPAPLPRRPPIATLPPAASPSCDLEKEERQILDPALDRGPASLPLVIGIACHRAMAQRFGGSGTVGRWRPAGGDVMHRGDRPQPRCSGPAG